MIVIFLHRSRGWKDFRYVSMCIYSTGCILNPIATKFGAQVCLVKLSSKMGYGGFIGNPRRALKIQNFNNFFTTCYIFNLKESLDRAY